MKNYIMHRPGLNVITIGSFGVKHNNVIDHFRANAPDMNLKELQKIPGNKDVSAYDHIWNADAFVISCDEFEKLDESQLSWLKQVNTCRVPTVFFQNDNSCDCPLIKWKPSLIIFPDTDAKAPLPKEKNLGQLFSLSLAEVLWTDDFGMNSKKIKGRYATTVTLAQLFKSSEHSKEVSKVDVPQIEARCVRRAEITNYYREML